MKKLSSPASVLKNVVLLSWIAFFMTISSAQAEGTSLEDLAAHEKSEYAQADWPAFFGSALYYRMHFLPLAPRDSKYFQPKLLSLEALALAHFCHWDEARQLLHENIAIREMTHDKGNELDRALSLIELLHEFKKEKEEINHADVAGAFFTDRLNWKIRFDWINRLKNPGALRVKVENRCAD